MPLELDTCVNSLFEPGNIGSSSGEVVVTAPSDYSPLLDFSKTYDNQYIAVI